MSACADSRLTNPTHPPASQRYSYELCGIEGKDRRTLIWAVAVTFGLLALAAFVLRCVARLSATGTRAWGPDDWAMTLTMVRRYRRERMARSPAPPVTDVPRLSRGSRCRSLSCPYLVRQRPIREPPLPPREDIYIFPLGTKKRHMDSFTGRPRPGRMACLL